MIRHDVEFKSGHVFVNWSLYWVPIEIFKMLFTAFLNASRNKIMVLVTIHGTETRNLFIFRKNSFSTTQINY